MRFAFRAMAASIAAAIHEMTRQLDRPTDIGLAIDVDRGRDGGDDAAQSGCIHLVSPNNGFNRGLSR